MKIIQTVVVFVSMLSLAYGNSANEAYQKAMKMNLQAMTEAEKQEDLQKVANTFQRIGEKETEEWLPDYYASLCYVHMSFKKGLTLAEKDQLLATAQKHIEIAESRIEENAEIVVMKGYITMAKLSADPSTRGQSLSPLTLQLFGKAMGMDPENPRARALMARMELGMAQFFGSGNEKACTLANESIVLFEKQEDREILPKWGKNIATGMLKNCGASPSKE